MKSNNGDKGVSICLVNPRDPVIVTKNGVNEKANGIVNSCDEFSVCLELTMSKMLMMLPSKFHLPSGTSQASSSINYQIHISVL